ncbi:hypothetical protein GZH53_04685 [Flavihumibacter sp. R14]|nr:hypothetical protein [Flavihumibacter soli]
MTIYEFTLLSEHDKANLVLDGVFLSDRIEGDMLFQLYYLDDFFVEMWHDVVLNRIYNMRPFSARRMPEEYLEDISLEDLVG